MLVLQGACSIRMIICCQGNLQFEFCLVPEEFESSMVHNYFWFWKAIRRESLFSDV